MAAQAGRAGSETPVVRFAPSPTGRIHVGNVRTALANWLFAKPRGGTFILRYDDTDAERSSQESADAILVDLRWLGLEPDQIIRQSDRVAIYAAAADRLRDAGLLYPCYETPDELERQRGRQRARGLPPVYDRRALRLTDAERQSLEAEGRRPHWRFLLPNFPSDPFATERTEVIWTDLVRGEQAVDLASLSDPVLQREDGTVLYTFTSVVDDFETGITHVIRGDDHVTNTGVQIALFRALGSELPRFGHHNLLQSETGEGLSKRLASLSVESLRAEGLEPLAVASLATLIGTSEAVRPVGSLQELGTLFALEKVNRSPSRFAPDELRSLNAKTLAQLPYEVVRDRLAALGVGGGEAFWNVVRGNIGTLAEALDWWQVAQGHVDPVVAPEDHDFIQTAAGLLPEEPWSEATWSEWTNRLKERTGRKGRSLFMPLRLALTGLSSGPELAPLLPFLGRPNTLARLRAHVARPIQPVT